MVGHMAAFEHEFPLDLIRRAPDLAAQLLERAAGGPLPRFDRARCEASEATTTSPAELRADAVVVLEKDNNAATAIIVENQQRYDKRKRYTWPVYVANIRARLECPVVLLVITPTTSLAGWCSQRIDLGGGYLVHTPLSLGLDTLEPVTDPDEAQSHPELAILIAATQKVEGKTALDALVPALGVIDEDRWSLYADYVLTALNASARTYLEEAVKTMGYEYKSDFIGRPYREGREEGKQEGLVEGQAGTLLKFLAARGITVSAETRERITSCTDQDQLDNWIRRAATAESADDLFA